MVPLKYTIRSLRSRWVTSLMTVFSTGLVVWASVLAFGLSAGVDHMLAVSGDPLDLIVVRKGATAESGSIIDAPKERQIAALTEIATNDKGEPFSSGEIVLGVNVYRRGDGGRTNLVVRGITEAGYALRPGFQIVQGRPPRPGLMEAITSRSIAARFVGAGLGEDFGILGQKFQIVGLFSAGDSAAESEIWIDRTALGSISNRENILSSIQLRATSAVGLEKLKQRISQDELFALDARKEVDYFSDQADDVGTLKIIGIIISFFLTVGAMFAVANTMFGSVVSRAREIGTLRALGFGRFPVMASFLLEAMLLCLAGGALGCLATLPVSGMGTGTANWATFTEMTFAFRFGWPELAKGVMLAVIMGCVGGFFPALRAVRMKIVDALREV